METKVKHRIIGIIIVGAALIAIALPLLFTSTEQLNTAKVQPLPDQAQIATQGPTLPLANNVEQNTAATTVATEPVLPANPQPVAEKSVETPTIQQAQAVEPASVTRDEPKAPAKPILKLVKPVVAKNHAKVNGRQHQLAWVVQMGSFKNKDNARHLTDRLRAAGFKAFTYTTKSGLRNSVRVYVGPEYKQASISNLSNKLAQKTKIQGVILPYKPLAL